MSQTDRQDRTDRQQTDSVGRTVLQTVAQKPECGPMLKRDGRPAEYRWRPMFNAAKFGWRPLLDYRAVTLPRRETHWNQLGYPKLPDGSQPLVGRGSPYCADSWKRYCYFTCFFSDCRCVHWLLRHSPTKLYNGCTMAIFCVLHFQRAACSMFQTCILNSH